MSSPIRLAILGCGAITRSEHIPAVIAHPGAQLVALADLDVSRANGLIQGRGLSCRAVSDYRELLGQVDAVINALPNHLHVTSNQEFLHAGVHVLCEKPLAITAADARACTELAKQKKLVLAVGMNRRFTASHPLLKLMMQEGLLGTVREYDFQYGGAFDWRSASGFYFDTAKAGGGALLDSGVHMLDSVLDWFGPVTAFDYQDDDWGSGIEANTILDVTHDGNLGEVTGRLRLSRTFDLKNRLLVRGTQAEAEISVHDPEVVVLHRVIAGEPVSQTMRLENYPGGSSYLRQLDNFLQSLANGSRPKVDGWQAVRVLELIENCRAHRRRIPEPWAQPDVERKEARA
jgi:predicted dehydrogenase